MFAMSSDFIYQVSDLDLFAYNGETANVQRKPAGGGFPAGGVL